MRVQCQELELDQLDLCESLCEVDGTGRKNGRSDTAVPSTVQYSTVQYSTVQYSAILWLS